MEVVMITEAIGLGKAPVKSSSTNQHPVFCRPDALPVTQPTVSEHWSEKYHIPWTCLPQAHLGVFKLCLWPLIAAGYLGPCHASHQTSDTSTQLCIRQLSQALSVLSQPRFLSNDVCVVLLTRNSFFRLCYLFVSDWLEIHISEMAYNVLMGTLNPTHLLTHSLTH